MVKMAIHRSVVESWPFSKWRSVQATPKLSGDARIFVKPVIGLRETDRPLAHPQQARLTTFCATHRVPAAVEEENANPRVEAVGHQRGVIAEKIDPCEA